MEIKEIVDRQEGENTVRDYYIGNSRITIHTDMCVKTQQEADEILKKIGRIVSRSKYDKVANA